MKKKNNIIKLCMLTATLGLSFSASFAHAEDNGKSLNNKLSNFESKLQRKNSLIPENIEKQLTESLLKSNDETKNYCNQTLVAVESQGFDKNLADLIAKKCVFLGEQEMLGYELKFGLKKIDHTNEDFKNKLELIKEIKSLKNFNTALKELRETSLLREGETKEFERVGSLFKNPDIKLTEKKKEEKDYYKKYSKDNYKVSKETYENFKNLNTALLEQKEKVLMIEGYFHDIDMKEIKKAKISKEEQDRLINQENKKFKIETTHPEKSFNKEIVINNKVFENYETYLLARKMYAEKTLTNIVELKKVRLSNKECDLLDIMNKGYEIKTFKNLTCK